MIRRALLVAALSLGPAVALAEELAQAATERLERAAGMLAASESAGDRIAALTETIRAYEDGLAAIRDEVRRLTLRERALTAQLTDENRDLSALLALMQTASRQTESAVLLHPGGAVETIRAGTLARSLVPGLQARAGELEALITELDETGAVLDGARATLEAGLTGARAARQDLAGALAARADDLPPPMATDDAAMQALINSAETLAALADSLTAGEAEASDAGPGDWAMPVRGEVRAEGEDRPGWRIATAPRALVTSPAPATVRFSAPVPRQGTVVILEADGGTLIILAGLGAGFLRRGDIVDRGDPVGFMGPPPGAAQENLNAGEDESSLISNETLYMEIRRERQPVDPGAFLRPGQE